MFPVRGVATGGIRPIGLVQDILFNFDQKKKRKEKRRTHFYLNTRDMHISIC